MKSKKLLPEIFYEVGDFVSYKTSGLLTKTADYLDKGRIPRIWVKLNQSATLVALCVALSGVYIAYKKYNEDNQKSDEDRIAKAWDVVTRMSGKNANGGQVSAIERLVKYSIPLNSVDLHNTFLERANLRGASLQGSNLKNAQLAGADLRGADLSGADLRGANLVGANLANVTFDGADLTNAVLYRATVDVRIILSRSLSEADLTSVKFVFEDEEGHEEWDVFWDTIAESPEADQRQKLINSACRNTDPNLSVVQSKHLPFKLPLRACKHPYKYGSQYVSEVPNPFTQQSTQIVH